MAWRCHGGTNAELIGNLMRSGVVKTPRAIAALRLIDRGQFVLAGTPPLEAYGDHPLFIGHAATISAPHMHAQCLDLLESRLHPGARALDVGSGSGIFVALFSALIFPSAHWESKNAREIPAVQGRVIGVEHIPALVTWAHENVSKALPPSLLASGHVQLLVGDGRLGHAADAPFDVIHVGAAAPSLPSTLVAQLAPGGRMIIPVGPDGGEQTLQVVDKDAAGAVTVTDLMSVTYVPLTDASRQLAR